VVHIIIGIVAISWGIWRILPDWMFVGEALKVLVFAALVAFGVLAVLGGLRRLRTDE
jgi:hypothetical protein